MMTFLLTFLGFAFILFLLFGLLIVWRVKDFIRQILGFDRTQQSRASTRTQGHERTASPRNDKPAPSPHNISADEGEYVDFEEIK